MADTTDNSGWSSAPSGASSIQTALLMNDAKLQANHVAWPTGGSSAQLSQETNNYDNNAVSPKGAIGVAQVEPDTLKAVEQQTGRKLDPHNFNDALTIHAYVMNQNLDKFGGDPSKAVAAYNGGWDPSKWGNPETTNYVNKFNEKTADSGWESAPSSKAADGWEGAPQQSSPIMDNIKGLGLQAANLVAGGLESPLIAAHTAGAIGSNLINGQGVGQAVQGGVNTGMQDFSTYSPENALNKMGVDTSGIQQTSGYQLPAKAMNFVANTVPEKLAPLFAQGIANQTGYDKPITDQDLADIKAGTQAGILLLPGAEALHRLGGPRGGTPAATAELDKLNEPGGESAPQQTPMGPNEGPQVPPISVDSNGGATSPLTTDPNMQAYVQAAQAKQQLAAGDLFPGTQEGEGTASPYDPNRVSSDIQQPFVPNQSTNLRQGSLDFDQANPPDLLHAGQDGDIGTPEQMAEVQPFKDAVSQKVEALNSLEPEQLSMFDQMDQKSFDQFGPDEAPRTLEPEEYAQTVQNLAAKDGTRFPLPEDMDEAYNQYLNTVRDDQGGLFDRATIAKNFADGAAADAMDRRVMDHPIVKAAVARVQSFNDQIAQAQEQGHGVTNLTQQRDLAAQTLEKAKTNIGKALGRDPTLPWERDGVVNMFTFGNLPEMWRSMKAVLQGIHGVAFKMLDKMINRPGNLDSTGKIVTAGMKQFVSREANRDWTQTVNEQPKAVLKGVAGLRAGIDSFNPYEAQEISPAEIKQQMQQAPDLAPGTVKSALRNNILQGGQQMSIFSRNPIVKYVTESMDRALRDAQHFTRTSLMGKDGLREAIRNMSEDELTGIRSLMELNEGVKEFTPNELKGRGFSDKQVDYYNKSRELSKGAYGALNRGRALAGLPAVDQRIGHIAGYFMGDFKRLVTDGEGNVRAVLAHNNRFALNTISQHFMETHPDAANLKLGEIKMNKLNDAGNGMDHRFEGYMNTINMLKDTNADVAQVVDAYKTYMSRDAANAMKYRAEYKSKEGVIGAEGRKMWQSAQKNAVDGAKQELHSLEAINKWAEVQKSIHDSKQFLGDPEIDKPNAKGMAQAYLDNVQHRNQGLGQQFVNSLVNGVSEITGVGPSMLRNFSAGTKTGLLTMFIGLGKLSHSFVTLIQPLQGIPVVNSLMKARGADLGLAQVSAVVKSMMSQKDVLQAALSKTPASDPFVRKAMEYAAKNDTYNSSQFQFGHLTDIDRTRGWQAAHTVAEFNVTGMEAGTRSFTYMYYAHMLRDLGLPDNEALATAHNAMRSVMVDYNAWERPGVFGKIGFLGDLTAMLTRYKFNQLSQYATAGKEMGNGKLMPMVSLLTTSLAAAGARGFIGYNVANELVKFLSTWAAKNSNSIMPTSLDQIFLHAIHGANSHLRDALNFGLPSALGLNLTGSLSHADDIPNDPLGTLLPQAQPLANIAKSAYEFTHNPNKQTAKTAAYDASPNSVKGIEENHMFTDANGNYYNPHTQLLETNRSPADQTKRTFGFRPVKEANDDFSANIAKEQGSQLAEVRQDVIKKMLSDRDAGSLTQQGMQQYAQRYSQLQGDPNDLTSAIVEHAGIGQHLDRLQREQGIPNSGLSSIYKYERGETLK